MDFLMVPRDRIDPAAVAVPTRGFSVLSALLGVNKFNMLASNIHSKCMTALNHASLINAKVPQAFLALMVWRRAQFPPVRFEPGGCPQEIHTSIV